MTPSPLRTTLVGSYPLPSWLHAAPSREALTDATSVVLATQQRLGIDLLTDGELSRFDINRYIERAVSWLGSAERISYVHPDRGFWVLPRSVADGKMAALVAGRDRYLGR